MGALRRAGVWLGLIEDEDDRGYGDRGYEDDDFVDEVDEPALPLRPRTSDRLTSERLPPDRFTADRLAEARESGRDRIAARSLTRPGTPGASPTYPTRDNLALAPQVQMRERSVAAEEEHRYQITTLHPTTYNEARTIGEHFRDGVPVIMNLTEMAEADAKRLVDFAAGLAFGLRGSMDRVTNRVFLLSPPGVKVTDADKARIAEGGFFNQS